MTEATNSNHRLDELVDPVSGELKMPLPRTDRIKIIQEALPRLITITNVPAMELQLLEDLHTTLRGILHTIAEELSVRRGTPRGVEDAINLLATRYKSDQGKALVSIMRPRDLSRQRVEVISDIVETLKTAGQLHILCADMERAVEALGRTHLFAGSGLATSVRVNIGTTLKVAMGIPSRTTTQGRVYDLP